MNRVFPRPIGLAWIAVVQLGCAQPAYSDRQEKESAMSEEVIQTLQSSEDPKVLVRAAVLLAQSEQRSDHEALLKSLQSDRFLLRLNTQEEYWGDVRLLRARRILEALSANKSPSARDTLLALTRNPVFTKEGGRVDLLIEATAVIRPAPPELVAFWDRHCQPEDGFTPLTIKALLANGSKPALELFEKKMADPGHEDDDKRVWMRNYLLPLRNQTALLESCDRLLKEGLPEHLRGDLVDVVFDYKPGEWYTPAVAYNPPALAEYSASARAQVRRIADYVLKNLKLTAAQKDAVERMVKSLESRRP
jgi:hypothetical protein